MDINYEVWYLNEKIFGLNEDKMNSIEKTLLSRIDKSLALLVLAGATVLAAAIRISLFPMLSLDMTVSLIPWYEEIAVNGLYQQVGNYNLVYQLLIWAMTLLPIPAPWSYKILSCVFDYLLAFSCALLVNELDKNNRPWGGIWTYTAVLICPVVFLNSAAWGQCDAIFSSFAILGLYFLLKEHYNRALLCLGLSFT
ncbi:MAG: hypothetical protein IJ364_09400, partial [Oscillospiraceae bacterium]|nr:hypothetical protein [Oscillospiraceae bacterium]